MDQAKANPAVTELFNNGDASLVYKERQVRKLRQKNSLLELQNFIKDA